MSDHELLSARAMSDAALRIAALPDDLLYPSMIVQIARADSNRPSATEQVFKNWREPTWRTGCPHCDDQEVE